MLDITIIPYTDVTFLLCPMGLWDQQIDIPCKDKQTLTLGLGLGLIPFGMTFFQLCKFCLLYAQSEKCRVIVIFHIGYRRKFFNVVYV